MPDADRLELVVEEAITIWEVDLLLEKRKVLRKRANDLIAEKMPKTKTAAELGMSVPQLNRLVEGR